MFANKEFIPATHFINCVAADRTPDEQNTWTDLLNKRLIIKIFILIFLLISGFFLKTINHSTSMRIQSCDQLSLMLFSQQLWYG